MVLPQVALTLNLKMTQRHNLRWLVACLLSQGNDHRLLQGMPEGFDFKSQDTADEMMEHNDTGLSAHFAT